MISRLFSKAGVGKASVVIIALTFLGSILGLFRDRALAHFLGAGVLSDAYYLSFTIPDIILNIFVMGALGGVFIPIFIDSLHTDEEEAKRLGSTFLLIISLVITVVCGICFFFVPDILHFFSSGSVMWSSEEFEIAVNLFRIMLIYPLLVGISNTIGGILNAYHHFFSYAASTALYNLGITLGLVVLYPYMGVYAAAAGVIIGFLMHLGIRLWELKYTSFRFTLHFDFSHAGLLRIFTLMPQRLVTLLAFYGVIFGFSILALHMEQGANTIRTYAWNFQSMPINLFAVSIATAALPMLSRHSTRGEMDKFVDVYGKSLSQILFFAIPSAVAMIIMAPSIIGLILGTGKFDTESITKTALSLSVFALSIPFESANHLYTRLFYAKKQVFIPTIAGVLFAIATLGFAYIAGPTFGYLVFPVAWVLGTLLQLLFVSGVYHMQTTISKDIWKMLAVESFKIAIASLTMASILYAIYWLHLGNILTVTFSVILGGAVYMGMHVLVRSQTVREALGFLYKRFGVKKEI